MLCLSMEIFLVYFYRSSFILYDIHVNLVDLIPTLLEKFLLSTEICDLETSRRRFWPSDVEKIIFYGFSTIREDIRSSNPNSISLFAVKKFRACPQICGFRDPKAIPYDFLTIWEIFTDLVPIQSVSLLFVNEFLVYPEIFSF